MVLLLFSPAAFGQSHFDGTWRFFPPLPKKPAVYSLTKGVLHCSGCIANIEIQADGNDHKVAETAYWDTVNVQVVNESTVEIIAKKAGKITTEVETVTMETRNRRIEEGPIGSHAISGSWQAYKANRSRNGSISRYRCTENGFSAETPLGEKFNAKFDGKDYPVEDDPGATMVSAKLLGAKMVELTSKRNGKVVAVKRMSVVAGGKVIHVIFESKESNTTTTFDLRREP